MAIDIKPENKKSFQLPGSFDVLFYYSIILLLILISGYLLVSQWNSEMQSQVDKTESVVKRLKEADSFKENEEFIKENQNRVDDYIFLFWNRRVLDNFFLLLENGIHPMAQLESVNLEAEERTVNLSGSIFNFDSLEQQYKILKDFEIQRDTTGWVPSSSINTKSKEEAEISQDFTEVYKSPVSKESKTDLDKGKEVLVLQNISEDDYVFGQGGASNQLIEGDWVEIGFEETIEPVKEVELDSIGEVDSQLGVSFEFNITLDEIIFES